MIDKKDRIYPSIIELIQDLSHSDELTQSVSAPTFTLVGYFANLFGVGTKTQCAYMSDVSSIIDIEIATVPQKFADVVNNYYGIFLGEGTATWTNENIEFFRLFLIGAGVVNEPPQGAIQS